ncbi:multidrug RND transporter [Xanthomonas albilineans]|nr:efflux transporter outer membrane subunit [Xanthomonas albilineans]PPU92309.1 multidrug RND transporter [Xanthomonas albilineans]
MNMLMKPSITSPRLRSLVVAALPLALAACASSRGLEPLGHRLDADRQLHLDQTLHTDVLAPAPWPQQDWWKALGDRQLDALIAEALQGTPSLEAADARLRLAQAQAGAADADRGAKLSLSAGYTGLQLPKDMVGDKIGGKYLHAEQALLDFSYGVDLWGGKRAAWEAVVDQAHAAQVDAQAARLELSAAVARAYVQLGYAWQLYDLAGAELARADRSLKLVRQRRDAGIDSTLQLRQAEARVPVARQQQQAAQQQIDEARIALAALLGRGPDRGLQIQRPRLLDPQAVSLPSVLPSDLLGRRPDVVAARWRVDAAAQGIHAAKTQFYPSINLTFLGGLVSSNPSDFFKSGSVLGILSPGVSLPLFDSGRLRSRLAERDAQYDLAVANYNQALVAALREVADQVSAARSLAQQAQQQAQAVDTAQAAFDLAQQRYHAGIGNYLDVLSVQQQLFEAQQRLASLQTNQILVSVRLNQALGGGYEATSAADAPRSSSASSHS